MEIESKIWKVLPVLVAAISGLAPIYVTYDIFNRGSIPERQLVLGSQYSLNPLRDLAPLAGRVGLSLTIGDHLFNNVVVDHFSLHNTGKVPILPTDIQEPISVNVDPPWKIIAVEEQLKSDGARLKWKRVSDQRFEALPALINPQDFMAYSVYLTNTRYDKSKDAERNTKIRIEARIVNMHSFSKSPGLTWDAIKLPIGFLVYLDFPAALFVVAVASLFMFWYLVLLRKLGRLSASYISVFSVIGLAALSYSAAEVIAYYIFGGEPSFFAPSRLSWRGNVHNWIVLATHVILSIWLYRKTRLRVDKAVATTTS